MTTLGDGYYFYAGSILTQAYVVLQSHLPMRPCVFWVFKPMMDASQKIGEAQTPKGSTKRRQMAQMSCQRNLHTVGQAGHKGKAQACSLASSAAQNVQEPGSAWL